MLFVSTLCVPLAHRVMRMGRWLIVCACLLILSWCFKLSAQDGICDPNLKPPAGSPSLGYQLRGDRCEGIYAREVGGTALVVASFTSSFEDFGDSFPQQLKLAWASPGNGPVRIRAYSLRSQTYYQMDTVRSSGGGSYEWPANVLAELNLRKSDIGVVARTSLQIGGTGHEVYLPARIGTSGSPSRGTPDLILLSDQELSEVYISLASLGPDGQQARSLRRDMPLGYGFYPAQRGIHVALPDTAAKGLYSLAAGATLRSGGSYTLRLWFYHDGI